MDIKIIKDVDLIREWDDTVEPYILERREKGSFERVPGQTILYEHLKADEAKAVLVLVHGFTEGMVKFYETAYYFLQAGMDVWMLQQRGHGKSYRAGVEDVSLVQIDDYNDLIEDLHYFVHEIVMPAAKEGLPLYVYGHSMGGGVSAIYLERYPGDFSKAVLNAPMLELDSGGIPVWAAVAFAKVMIFFGKGKNYMPGSKPYDGKDDFEGSCTTCRERYMQYQNLIRQHDFLKMCATSITTAMEFFRLTKDVTKPENMEKVRAKVLLFQAGKDNMVLPGGQNTFAGHIKDAELVRIEEAKHEIYRCGDAILQPYWDKILSFLG